MENLRFYISPIIDIIDVEVESGFAISDVPPGGGFGDWGIF